MQCRSANPRIADPTGSSHGFECGCPNIGSAGAIYGPPCVVFYTVDAGDSWRSIAEPYNADVAVLMEANPGVTPIPGTRVKVPVNSKRINNGYVLPVQRHRQLNSRSSAC